MLVAIGVLTVFDVAGVWTDGTARFPVLLLYLAAGAVLHVRRPATPTLALALTVVPAALGTALAVAVAAGWVPPDLPVTLGDEPLSESPRNSAPFALLLAFLWGLAAWGAAVLRRHEVRTYYRVPAGAS